VSDGLGAAARQVALVWTFVVGDSGWVGICGVWDAELGGGVDQEGLGRGL